MTVATMNILKRLDKNDQEKVSYFIKLLLNQSQYRTLKEEISFRRKEIQHGDTLTHDDIWDMLNV